jgi:Probable Zinc-ribbon domain
MSLADKFPEIAKQWHLTKNGDLTPYDVVSSSRTKVWWLCPNSCSYGCLHEWETTPRARTVEKKGCHYCSEKLNVICIHQSIVFTHPEIAKQWHPTKNGSLTPEQVSSGSGRRVWWICDKTCSYGCTHEWDAFVYARCVTNSGCPHCYNQINCIHKSIKYTHPHLLDEMHSTKNLNIDILNLRAGSHKEKIWWVCKTNKDHIWLTSVQTRTLGHGCPTCVNKTEKQLYDVLLSKYADTIHNYRPSWSINTITKRTMPYDFFIPSHKVIIELDGPHHFKQVHNWNPPEETVRRDVLKMKYALEHNLTIIRCVQSEYYKDTESIATEKLLPLIKIYDKPCVIYNNTNSLYSNHILLLNDLLNSTTV